jgi:AcrR family transcriptional regulator
MTLTDRTHKMSRDRILDGAVAILDSGHYGDLTVDALARSLRMSKSTLYKYFMSKEDVIVALVRDACEQAEAEVERTLAGGTAAEQLVELARIIGRHGQRLPRAVSTEPERLPSNCLLRLSQTREVFSHAAELLMQRGVSRREFDFPNTRLAAVAFVAAAHAVLVDGARTGIAGYGEVLELIPRLFLPGMSAVH